jgi:hypothetical protein
MSETDFLALQKGVDERSPTLEERVTALEGMKGDITTLRSILGQVANVIPDGFRPPKDQWEKTGVLAKAIEAALESLFQEMVRAIGERDEALREITRLRAQLSEAEGELINTAIKLSREISKLVDDQDREIKELREELGKKDAFIAQMAQRLEPSPEPSLKSIDKSTQLPIPEEVQERGWQWRPVGDGAFAPPFGTIRVCRHCGCLVAGGPTACVHCVESKARDRPWPKRLEEVVKQIAMTLPEEFRPPEADWGKTNVLCRAVNTFMETVVKERAETPKKGAFSVIYRDGSPHVLVSKCFWEQVLADLTAGRSIANFLHEVSYRQLEKISQLTKERDEARARSWPKGELGEQDV